MNMTEWLRTLGLERYEQAFHENRIEADVLPSLAVEDLKDLGVTLVGDRRRLLDAEGFDTADLREAKVLLEELAA